MTIKIYTLFNHAFLVQKHHCTSSFPMYLINKVLFDANLMVTQSLLQHITSYGGNASKSQIDSLKQFRELSFLCSYFHL